MISQITYIAFYLIKPHPIALSAEMQNWYFIEPHQAAPALSVD